MSSDEESIGSDAESVEEVTDLSNRCAFSLLFSALLHAYVVP